MFNQVTEQVKLTQSLTNTNALLNIVPEPRQM